MLTAADVSALPPLPLLVAASVVLVALVGSLVVIGRRRRAGHGTAGEDAPVTPDPAGAAEEVADLAADPSDEDPSSDEDSLPEDPRALRLLVRSLEAALQELSADARRQPEPVELAAVDLEAVEPEAGPTTATARRHGLISAALTGVDEADRAARLGAALQRSRAPRSFSRPVLAACIGADMSALLPTHTAPEAPVTDGPVADATPEDGVAPAVVEPAEPERVLPVPAEPVPDIAPRRRLFGRRVA